MEMTEKQHRVGSKATPITERRRARWCRGLRAGIAGVTAAGLSLVAYGGAHATLAGAATHGRRKLGSPVVIGASLSLSGDFSGAGKAFTQGYHLWQTYQNAHGGLLGHKIELKILSDKSTPTQAATNYSTLIGHDHVKLTIGPFSSLLTLPSAKIAHRYGYALVEGAGGAPDIFTQNLPNVFDVSYPVAKGLVPIAKWIASMPKNERPKTAAYATVTTIFTSSQFPVARKILEKAGVKTVYTKVFPTETTDFTPIASAISNSNAQVVMLGSVATPTVSSFMSAFETAHYSPKVFADTSGSDEGKTFLKAVGTKNALGVINPNGWYPGYKNKLSEAMVKAYRKRYGGSVSDVTATTAEAYSVGEVLTQAVEGTHGFTNKKIIKYLHSNKTFTSVQGPVKFNKAGENDKALVFAFQWQKKHGKPVLEQVLPTSATGSSHIVFPKPAWS